MTFKPHISSKSKAIEAESTQKFLKKHKDTQAGSKNKNGKADKKGSLAEQLRAIDRGHKGEGLLGSNGLESVLEKDSETDKSFASIQKPDRVEIIYKRHELREKELEEQRKLLEIEVCDGRSFNNIYLFCLENERMHIPTECLQC